MFIIIDLIIILIIVLFTYIGYRRGLIKVAFKIFSFIVSVLVAVLLSYPISTYIMNNTNIAANIEQRLEEKFIKEEKEINTSKVITDYVEKSIDDVKNAGIKAAIGGVTTIGIRIITAIALFIITKIILFFFKQLAIAIGELPVIKQFNKSGGFIYGLLQGILIIYFIFGVMSFILPMTKNIKITDTINKTYLAKFMYNNNIILMLIF